MGDHNDTPGKDTCHTREVLSGPNPAPLLMLPLPNAPANAFRLRAFHYFPVPTTPGGRITDLCRDMKRPIMGVVANWDALHRGMQEHHPTGASVRDGGDGKCIEHS